jgi:uncharacterized protein YecA (UPF0149 family)
MYREEVRYNALPKRQLKHIIEKHNHKVTEWNDRESGEILARNFHPDTIVNENARINRNDPCPCKSGKKYKKCCGNES